ncbi:piggyBac transposable element-derived protein 2-like [Homalodisca vitripennis]|uniref:piggyBac transposable element-derived protein 2-like n=1 Tax=Homalodisca vitripennis TaxID=197043 RepID=UPI001EECA248|nr:piggyBac transposable element-derived protein 2-like [Homalodisca vitripennis]
MCEKNLNLHEILTMLEDEEIQVPPDEEIGVYIQPPINANDDVTDEDSGDEDMTSIHHLSRKTNYWPRLKFPKNLN